MALNIENILLKEERKEYNQEYLNNTTGKQIQYTTSILFKLVYLLPREEHNQDKNHWKGELKSGLSVLLGNFGGVKSSKLILDKFNEKKYESYSFILRMIKERYAKLYSPKEFSIDIINDIADNYYPKIAEWIYTSGKDTVKDKTGIILKTKINEFVNNLFE